MTNQCPECGKPVPSGRQICPACLLARALDSQTLEADSPVPEPGEIAGKFPQFEILECLGRGGMGVVYKARQKSLNRLVAIKILAPERVRDVRFEGRFAREAELLARLSHPRIVTIHDFGETDGLCYLVMEFVDGVSLRDLLREGKLEPAQALAIVPEICEALQFAHDKGIVHRDIKPGNILLDRNGHVKVADFGIAKLVSGSQGEETGGEKAPADAGHLTEAGKVLGTPSYMAPEQSGEPARVDHRADIYALGVVFYQMLTGELPGRDMEPPSQKVRVDVRLDEVVLRALEKNPERRYQQASFFKTRVETVAEEMGRKGNADFESREAPSKNRGNNPWPSVFAVLCMGICAFAIAWGFRKSFPYNVILCFPAGFGIGIALVALARFWPFPHPEFVRKKGFAWSFGLLFLLGFIPIAVHFLQTESTDAIPRVVKTNPPALANDVDPSLDKITVAFDRPMKGGSWSWTGGGDTFPESRGSISYDESRTTCTNPVKLQPGKVYWIGINSPSHRNFRSESGIPARRHVLLFSTKSTDGNPTPIPRELLARAKAINDERPSPSGKAEIFDWNRLAAEGRLTGGMPVETDGRTVLKVENATDAPLQVPLLKIENPGIRSMHYAVSGEIKYEGVQGSGYLEMWNVYPQGRFFSRTLGDPGSGPMAKISGTSGWREFLLPFDRTGSSDPPVSLELNLFLPGRGTVFIGPLKLVQYGEAETSSEATPVGKTGPESGEAVQQSAAFVELLAAGKFSEAFAQFSPEMGRAMPEAKLAAIWKELGSEGGAFLGHDLPRVRQEGAFLCAFVPCRWEREQLDIKVVFDKEGKVSGLWKIATAREEKNAGESGSNSEPGPDALGWLAMMDAGDYTQSWEAASEGFRSMVTRDEWVEKSEAVRSPLGTVISRKPTAGWQASGNPKTASCVVKFDTSFAGMADAAETVTFAREKDGKWKVAGYLILPRTDAKKEFTPQEKEAAVAAGKWLGGIDAGNYPQSWREASAIFRGAISEEGWATAVSSVRKPLGSLVFRRLKSARYSESLPGAPDGRYVVMLFDTSFAAKKSAVETVTFVLEKDDGWRAAGYFIR